VLGFVCIDTVQRLAKIGKLRCTKIGKRLMFDPHALAEFIEKRSM
jgi:hypothetical protein